MKNRFKSIEMTSLWIGGIGTAVSLIAWLIHSEAFFIAWLFSWFYWFSITMGCLGFFMIYRLTSGAWGQSLELILLAGGKTIDILVVLFLPVFAGIKPLFLWSNLGSHPNLISSDPVLIHKHPYLNIPFWCARTLFYFISLYLITWILTRSRQDLVRKWSAGGFVFLFLMITFASIDWIMALEAHWYSSVFGMMIIAGQGICGLAFPLFITHFLQKRFPDWNPPQTPKALRDQGSLLLTTCVLWTYLAFAQWLIVWIGNIPETVTWYSTRADHVWAILAWIVVIMQFAIPFQLLLFQRFKTKLKNLASLGLFLLIARWLDLYWVILPALRSERFTFNWIVFPNTIAIGGIWFFYFARQLRTLTPISVESVYSHKLKEALNRA